jgi:hypothetical protein
VARTGAEVLGPKYFDLYRGLNHPTTYEEFATIAELQGLRPPTRRMFAHVRRLYASRQPNYVAMNVLDVQLKRRRESWTLDRVQALVDERVAESEQLEFKRELAGPATTAKPWAGLGNTGGGHVVYGIEEDDLSRASTLYPIGLDGVREKVAQVNRNIDPPVDLTITTLPIANLASGFCVVKVEPAVPGRIHLVDGRAPVRDGATTRYMTSAEIRRWVVESEGLPAPVEPHRERHPDEELPFD